MILLPIPAGSDLLDRRLGGFPDANLLPRLDEPGVFDIVVFDDIIEIDVKLFYGQSPQVVPGLDGVRAQRFGAWGRWI